ncbi:MAG: LysR family transcriptional regulator [Sedimentitalea sp.]|uniref:LysR family transcriptional regulator n=1 Tax=Sedimentitalea sp. TaxID=2048915 RepID=UPI003264B6D5
MDLPPKLKDWSLVQSFLAVADTGSLSAGARLLGCSQPTLGRQIQALESELSVELFTRHARGFALSDAGAGLVPMARQMQSAMQAMTLAAAGQSKQLEGTVRITASVFASHHLLPPIMAEIREAEPAIQLDLIPSDTTENLLFREADIAIRMYRPTQLDLVARHVADLELGVFAACSYLDRVGRPKTAEDLLKCDLIGYDRNDLILRTMSEMGWTVRREDFAMRCDNQATYWELLRAGCGVGFSQVGVARADPTVEQIDLGFAMPSLPVWLTAHQAMRQTPRLRRVWDLLASGLAQA